MNQHYFKCGALERLLGSGLSAARSLFGVEHESSALLAVRVEATEALLVLLYDRIDGGVRRSDFAVLLECAASCHE